MSNTPTKEQLEQVAKKANAMQREVMGLPNPDVERTKTLLSDEEQYQAITDICFENGGVNKPMVDKLNDLINTQKRLYAESVIGEEARTAILNATREEIVRVLERAKSEAIDVTCGPDDGEFLAATPLSTIDNLIKEYRR